VSELKAEDLHFKYADGTEVLRGVSLAVRRGEMVTILGENASGKTTLLKLLAGLVSPSSGCATVDGVPVHRVRERVGIVFQNPEHQMIAATVEEEIALGLELRGVPQPAMHRQVEGLLSRFDLTALRSTSPDNLSGGQKQRVALAAVMVSQPEFLLFDEPDSLLDAPSRAELEASVEIVRDTCGIVWTSPHPKRMPVSDRKFELRDGVLISL
jgi:energy-coupling factor transporter ATP-binding protein EcfA2